MRRNVDEDLRVLERRLRSGDESAALAFGRRLVRLGRATEDQVAILGSMGTEALLSWADRKEYEWRPETIESGDHWIELGHTDETEEDIWRQGWSVSGYAIRLRNGVSGSSDLLSLSRVGWGR